MRRRLFGADLELALHHVENVDRDARVEPDATFGRIHDVALEELAHGLDELGGSRTVMWKGHRTLRPLRATERRRRSGHTRPAWNADVTATTSTGRARSHTHAVRWRRARRSG